MSGTAPCCLPGFSHTERRYRLVPGGYLPDVVGSVQGLVGPVSRAAVLSSSSRDFSFCGRLKFTCENKIDMNTKGMCTRAHSHVPHPLHMHVQSKTHTRTYIHARLHACAYIYSLYIHSRHIQTLHIHCTFCRIHS